MFYIGVFESDIEITICITRINSRMKNKQLFGFIEDMIERIHAEGGLNEGS